MLEGLMEIVGLRPDAYRQENRVSRIAGRPYMKRTPVGAVIIGIALLGLGWSVGKAQGANPDFEIVVNAPAGETTVECKRGCSLAWVERGVNPNSTPMSTFKFSCSGERCSSARVGGWLKP